MPQAQVYLTFCRPVGIPGYILCPQRAAVDNFLFVAQKLLVYVKLPLIENHLSLLLQQCPICLVRLIWMFFAMGGRWL